ncbi:AAA family ATPase [Acidianus manzaensis]|uniref:ATPase n=1 Tax=Acidianus manzaensis TaxID=282676 RepID=A0A1W6K2Y0_9CREN|nr:AAA family ATPase [Acidianus manzaensis]ARM76812.1 ATPase [Acidianus manzaensis]
MRLVLKRKECDELRNVEYWLLLYGRRKTGKTTLIKNCIKYDYFVTLANETEGLLESGERIKIEELLKEVRSELKKGSKVVIDEFQRLPEKFYVDISTFDKSGILILSGSSYGILNKVFDRNSPLLGLITPKEIPIISYEEVLSQLEDPLLSTLFRDPWIIPFINSYEEFVNRIKEFSLISKGLIGEVFKEEERSLTEIYYQLLLRVAEGIWKTSELAGILQVKGGEATVSSLMNKLSRMGLIKKIRTLGKEYYYRHVSPVISLSLYAESKYLITERDVRVHELPIGLEVQFSIGEMISKYYGGDFVYSPKEDIDIIVMNRKKRIIAFEVKMGEITKSEAKEAIKKMSKVAEKVGLISLKDKPPEIGDVSIGPKELIEISKELNKKKEEK